MAEDLSSQEQLALLTAALFAVRMFKAPVEDSFVGFPPEELASWLAGKAQERTEAADRSALDAAAILAAVAKITG
jgi:hypothetical protein